MVCDLAAAIILAHLNSLWLRMLIMQLSQKGNGIEISQPGTPRTLPNHTVRRYGKVNRELIEHFRTQGSLRLPCAVLFCIVRKLGDTDCSALMRLQCIDEAVTLHCEAMGRLTYQTAQLFSIHIPQDQLWG